MFAIVRSNLTKNHRENDKELTRGFMPEIRDSNLCPVKSFVSYTSKLNPLNDKLWQKPKDSFCSEDDVWFCNIPVGQRTLSSFMSKMSALCELSIKYTNHSVRATGATLVKKYVQFCSDYGRHWTQIGVFLSCLPKSW